MRCAVLLLASLTAVPALAQNSQQATVVRSACGPDAETFSVTTRPESDGGKATVAGQTRLFLIEEQERVAFCPGGCGVTVKVGLDGGWAGATSGNSYIEVPVAAGDHHLCTIWQSRLKGRRKLELASFHAQEGQDLFYRVRVVPSTTETISGFTLEPISADEGRLLLSSSPKSIWAIKK